MSNCIKRRKTELYIKLIDVFFYLSLHQCYNLLTITLAAYAASAQYTSHSCYPGSLLHRQKMFSSTEHFSELEIFKNE